MLEGKQTIGRGKLEFWATFVQLKYTYYPTYYPRDKIYWILNHKIMIWSILGRTFKLSPAWVKVWKSENLNDDQGEPASDEPSQQLELKCKRWQNFHTSTPHLCHHLLFFHFTFSQIRGCKTNQELGWNARRSWWGRVNQWRGQTHTLKGNHFDFESLQNLEMWMECWRLFAVK